MPRRITYPRNEAHRRDHILSREIIFQPGRDIKTRNDMIANDVHVGNVTPSVVLTGTMVAGGVTEAEMVTGGETLIITLTGDTFVPQMGGNNAQTTALLAGITGDDDYATIAALTDSGDVARTSATVVTITYPVGTGYSIAADEDVTVAVPATAVNKGVAPPAPAVVVISEGA